MLQRYLAHVSVDNTTKCRHQLTLHSGRNGAAACYAVPRAALAVQNTIVYVLNRYGSTRWFYSFESGATRVQQQMKHELAAYVLLLQPPQKSDERPPSPSRLHRPKARLATVLARQASPPFTMVSYRRQHRTARQDNRLTPDGAKQPLPLHSPSPSPRGSRNCFAADSVLNELEGKQQQEELFLTLRECDENSSSATNAPRDRSVGPQSRQQPREAGLEGKPRAQISPHDFASSLSAQSRSPEQYDSVHRAATTPPSLHRDTAGSLQLLTLLQLFARFVPLDEFSLFFGSMDSCIQRRWVENTAASRMDPSGSAADADVAGRSFVAAVASKFSLANFVPRRSRAAPSNADATSYTTERFRKQMILRSCADLVLDIFSSPHVEQALTPTADVPAQVATQMPPDEPTADQRKRFDGVVANVFNQVAQLLAGRRSNHYRLDQLDPGAQASEYSPSSDDHNSVAALVDDVLSLISSEPRYRRLQGAASALLLRQDDMLDVAVEELFQACMTQTSAATSSKQRPVAAFGNRSAAIPTSQLEERQRVTRPQRSSVWTRRWFLLSSSVTVVPLCCGATNSQDEETACGDEEGALSLLGVVVFVRMFASVDVELEGARLSLRSSGPEAATSRPEAGHSSTATTTSKTVLLLDRRAHEVASLPNGLTPAAARALFGDWWGVSVYSGRVADNGAAIDLLLFTEPTGSSFGSTCRGIATASRVTVRRIRVRLSLDGSVKSSRHGESYVGAFVEVSRATYRPLWHGLRAAHTRTLQQQMDELMAQSWTPTMELGAMLAGV